MHPGNNLTRDEARRRAELIQTPLYDISLDLTRDSDTFACEATIHFLCHEPGANTFIDFLAPSVDSCELNGEEVPKEAFSGARITLENLREANELHVIGTCSYQNVGAGLSKITDALDLWRYAKDVVVPDRDRRRSLSRRARPARRYRPGDLLSSVAGPVSRSR